MDSSSIEGCIWYKVSLLRVTAGTLTAGGNTGYTKP